MGQRNMVYTGPMLETEHGNLRPEPCLIPYVGIPNFPQPANSNNNQTILPPPPLTRTTFNPQHMPENHGPLPPAITQYSSAHHPGNNVFMTPSPGTRVFPVAINHGMQDQIPFSTIRGAFENGQFIDGLNGAFKRKNAEGFLGNIQYFYPAPGASSSAAIPMNEGTMMDGPLVMEPAVPRSGRSRGSGAIAVDPVLAHSSGHLIQGNFGGQPLQAVPNLWLDQQFCANGSDGSAFSWNHGPGIPYLQGHMNGGAMEAANAGLHGYQVTPSNRNPATFVHQPPHAGPHNLHHQPTPSMPQMQASHNMDFHPQLASTSRRLPSNSAIVPFQSGMEQAPRFVGPLPPTGLRVYRPHRRELMVDATARHRGFPHLRVLPEDGVAILDISGFHEVRHSVDHHRDMRLDIDHMSYEELLALGEQIGSVGSGLSDEFILQHLKTRVFATSKSSESEDASCVDQELNCVICQTNYDDEEHIGVLDCGHEYHVECVKKWLTVKNTCPVCKSTGLTDQAKES